MMRTTLSFRLDPREREAFAELCAAHGVTSSEVLRELVRGAVSRNALPVECNPWYEVPETKAALEEIEAGGGKTFRSVEALMNDLCGNDPASYAN